MKLYCYDNEAQGDPHAVVLELSDSDAAAVNVVLERDGYIRGRKLGTFVKVTDQESGRVYEVASAPCAANCHCAMVARLVEESGELRAPDKRVRDALSAILSYNWPSEETDYERSIESGDIEPMPGSGHVFEALTIVRAYLDGQETN